MNKHQCQERNPDYQCYKCHAETKTGECHYPTICEFCEEWPTAGDWHECTICECTEKD